MYEELFVAFMIGISFSNAFVCMLMGFGTTAVERRNTGKWDSEPPRWSGGILVSISF
jgi:hypothetical protein